MGDESTELIICGRSAHKTPSVQIEQDWIRTGVTRLRIGVNVQVQAVFYTTTMVRCIVIRWQIDNSLGESQYPVFWTHLGLIKVQFNVCDQADGGTGGRHRKLPTYSFIL